MVTQGRPSRYCLGTESGPKEKKGFENVSLQKNNLTGPLGRQAAHRVSYHIAGARNDLPPSSVGHFLMGEPGVGNR